MNEFDDKTQTFKFEAVKEEKPQQNRSANDEFSAARRGYDNYESYQKKKEKGNGGLIAIACILTVLLVVVIVAGIFILKRGSTPQLPEEEIVEVMPEEKEEEVPEVMNASVLCNIVFYSDSIMAKDGEYTVLADLYDEQMYKFDSKKLIIGGETDIRQDGTRITPQAFCYIIENTGGEGLVYEGEVRERDGVVLAISFESPVEEEETPEESEVESIVNPTPEENNEEPKPEETPEAQPPTETPEETPVTENTQAQ